MSSIRRGGVGGIRLYRTCCGQAVARNGVKFEQLVENRIVEAIEAGVFEGLAGEGAPLPLRDADRLAGDLWLAHHILGNAGTLPEWLELARTIERDRELLTTIEGEHGALVERAEDGGVAAAGAADRGAPAGVQAGGAGAAGEAGSLQHGGAERRQRATGYLDRGTAAASGRTRARGAGRRLELRRRLSRAGRGWYRERSPSDGRQSRPKGGEPAAWPKSLSVRMSHLSLH